jgi:hypothetical protein
MAFSGKTNFISFSQSACGKVNLDKYNDPIVKKKPTVNVNLLPRISIKLYQKLLE